KRINAKLKDSIPYYQLGESIVANDVLHGRGPCAWLDRYSWRPRALGVEDVLIPDGTTLEMDNLEMFSLYRKYTAKELWTLTNGPRVDPGWNKPLVERALEWADEELHQLMGTSWPETWSSEKISERLKSDSGLYASASVPTIDCFDLYYWSDEKKQAGWRRKMILDAWGNPGIGALGRDAPSMSN